MKCVVSVLIFLGTSMVTAFVPSLPVARTVMHLTATKAQDDAAASSSVTPSLEEYVPDLVELEKLQDDYHELEREIRTQMEDETEEQDENDEPKLKAELPSYDIQDMAFVAQRMVETAMDVVKLQKHSQQIVLKQVQHEFDLAEEDRQHAHGIRKVAHAEGQVARRELQLLDSLKEHGYPNLEDCDNVTIAKEAESLEEDARQAEIKSALREMEASLQLEAAQSFYDELEDYEEALQETMKEIKALQKEYNDKAEKVGEDGTKHHRYVQTSF